VRHGAIHPCLVPSHEFGIGDDLGEGTVVCSEAQEHECRRVEHSEVVIGQIELHGLGAISEPGGSGGSWLVTVATRSNGSRTFISETL
jgi:hypothetical protein